MKPTFIGITGGSGAGKSTLCTALQEKYPDKIGLIQLDDYFKPKAEVLVVDGMLNYDSPEALYLDKLVEDLTKLSNGESAFANTKNSRLNPDYSITKKRITVEFKPLPIMLVEGFLALYDERVRNFLNTSIWLEAPHDKRWERRVHFKYPEYEEKVLRPMQEKYFEPTKKFAGHIIDAGKYSKEEVFSEVEGIINKL